MNNAKSTRLRTTGGAVSLNRPGRKVAGSRSAGFYSTDKHGNISVVSQSLARILQYSSQEEVLGHNIAEKFYERKTDRAEFLKKLSEEGFVENYLVKMLRKDGSQVVLSAHSTMLCDKNGDPVGVEGILEEVAAMKPAGKSKERPIPDLVPVDVNAASSFDGLIKDPLTGLCNYQYFMTCLDAETRRVERIFHPTSLMMIDLDNFSGYNQKNGREKGDELLKAVAGLLKVNLRTTDILCRQAQDQFLVLLPETNRDEAMSLAKSVKDAIQAAMTDNGITISIGMSRFIVGMTIQEFFLQANLGVYMAKAAGRNEACFYG